MTEEEKKAIEYLNKDLKKADMLEMTVHTDNESLRTALNLIKSQQEEIEKLRNNNKRLLKKLRNRVKEVKKLTKYSLYKKEFSRLNKEIEKKDKIIDEMSNMLVRVHSENKEVEFIANIDIEEKKEKIKQYFEKKVEKSNE